MKRFLLNLIFVISLLELNAQKNITIFVLDSLSNQPLQLLKISVAGKNSGDYTDAKGYIHFENLEIKDTLLIENIFYQPKYLLVKNLNTNQKILLCPSPIIINDITVKPLKNRTIEIGFSKLLSNGSFGTMVVGTEISVLIKPTNSKEARIKAIILKFKRNPKNNSLIKIHLYQNEKGKVGKEIYLVENLITLSEIKEDRFYIEKQEILLPHEGVFVSMEWIGKNKVNGENYTVAEFKSSPSLKTNTHHKTKTAVYYKTFDNWEPLTVNGKNLVPLFGLLVENQKK
ncbi:MAG: hypothetical protein U0W24_02605 [Bacteroidales bacterium]